MRVVDFQGTDRFVVHKRLGAGAMGVVYECTDRQRGTSVALKTLARADPASIYRFKNEFRTLAGIAHPNLVSLYELDRVDDQWFFTMQLVRGVDLLTFHRQVGHGIDCRAPTLTATDVMGTVSENALPASPPRDIAQLRDTMRQLAQGVHALHIAGKLHRDIKPSNILVDEDGRVVVVDFGLATDYSRRDFLIDASVVGTATYMAPEQCRPGERLGPAADWYAVGTVLYELLTGCRPYVGSAASVVMKKQFEDPVHPSYLLGDLPHDLVCLCWQMMARNARERPSSAHVLKALGVASTAPLTGPNTGPRRFVGREREMATLQDGFRDVLRHKAPQVVLITGVAGIGKTALVNHFLELVEHEHDALVLGGRCYEWESVPYKAVDTVVDALGRYLERLPVEAMEGVLPRDTNALTHLFPVLEVVPALARWRQTPLLGEPQEIRSRGLAALAELLRQLSKKRPLVIRIDDFQWGDTESASLLVNLLFGPKTPRIFLCITWRPISSAAVSVLRERLADPAALGSVALVPLAPLSDKEQHALAESRLRERGADPAFAEMVVRECRGNPLFVEEVVSYLHTSSDSFSQTEGKSLFRSLEAALSARLALLSASQRYLLELVCVAGNPVSEKLVSALVPDVDTAIATLRSARLLRRHRVQGEPMVEAFHDRIREVLVEQLSSEQVQERALSLAHELERIAPDDVASLALMFSRAQDSERSAQYALRAAQEAMASYAFARAAMFFRLALSANQSPKSAHTLRVRLAKSLAYSGERAAAGEMYMLAAREAAAMEKLELLRCGAEEFLRSGHVSEGVVALREVLASVDLRLAPTTSRAFVSLLRKRARLRVNGLRFVERPASELPSEELWRIDVCWSSAVGLGLTDPLRGADLQTQHLLLALRAGEPTRLARALALEAAYVAIGGNSVRKRAQALIEMARDLGERSEMPHALAIAVFSEGLLEYQCGNWRIAFERFEYCDKVFRGEYASIGTDPRSAVRFAVDCLFNLGELREFAQRVPVCLDEARQHGDVHGETDMRTGLPNAAWLLAGQPERARAHCEEAAARWQHLDFFLQHYYAGLARANIELYEGNGTQALKVVDAMWPHLSRSMVLRVQAVRVEAFFVLGRALIVAATEEKGLNRSLLLTRLAALARRLRREDISCAAAYRDVILAHGALLRGRQDRGREYLFRAKGRFEWADMKLCAQACAMAIGTLTQGEEGDRLLATAADWMQQNKVSNPRRLAGMMIPAAAVEPAVYDRAAR